MSDSNQKCCENLWQDFVDGKAYIHIPLIFILIVTTFFIH